MTSIVLELQSKALDTANSVSSLLRTALIVAKKLKQDDIIKWLNCEMNGYTDSDEIPQYRQIAGQVMINNPFYGLQPVVFESATEAEIVSKKPFGVPISQIESLLAAKRKGTVLGIPLPPGLEHRLMQILNSNTPPVFIANESQMHSVLDIVRNNILEWTLKLEEKGIMGNDMTFTSEEKKQASTIIYNIGAINNSQIQQGTINSTQTQTIHSFDKKYFNEFIKELKEYLSKNKLSKENNEIIESDIETIESQLKSPKPKKGILKETIISIRSILEGATGSIVGSELIKYFPVILKMLE